MRSRPSSTGAALWRSTLSNGCPWPDTLVLSARYRSRQAECEFGLLPLETSAEESRVGAFCEQACGLWRQKPCEKNHQGAPSQRSKPELRFHPYVAVQSHEQLPPSPQRSSFRLLDP